MANVTENNGRDKDNINTSGIQFSNKDGFVSSALVLGYWNDKLSIKLHPALEASKQTENNTFDYERATITSLTVEKMQTLLNGIEDFIFPAITAGEEKNISVIVNLSSLVTIGTGLSLTGKITPYLAIHKDLNADTKLPQSSMYYEFKSIPMILDYNASNGDSQTTLDRFTEFKAFINCMRFAVPTLMNAGVHASKYSERYTRKKHAAEIQAIASKLGVDVSKPSYARPDVFGTRSGNFTSAPALTASVEHSETIESLDNFMD